MAGIIKVDRVQSDSNLAFQVAGANVAYMNSTGLQMTGGTLSLGGTTIIPAVGQIAFPATQSASADANTLDDYEEGTWTPNVYHTSTNNSTWVSKYGYYRKIGGQVTCWFVCDAGNSGTAGSQLTLSGIPFASASFAGTITFGIWGANGPTERNGGITQVSGSTALLYTGGSGLSTQMSYISGTFTYFAA